MSVNLFVAWSYPPFCANSNCCPANLTPNESNLCRYLVNQILCTLIVFLVQVKVHCIINEAVYIISHQSSNRTRPFRENIIIRHSILITAQWHPSNRHPPNNACYHRICLYIRSEAGTIVPSHSLCSFLFNALETEAVGVLNSPCNHSRMWSCHLHPKPRNNGFIIYLLLFELVQAVAFAPLKESVATRGHNL